MVGIISYGSYIPQNRIKTADIAKFWDKSQDSIASLGVSEKSVASIDEDAITMAIVAGHRALNYAHISKSMVKALSVGSESHPYAVKPSATIVGQALGIPNNYLALDTQFACKAATAAMIMMSLMHGVKIQKYGLIIGSDAAQAKPGDVLEYTAASASAAYVLGKGDVIANILNFTSYSSDTPDFWRRDGQKFPTHAGRFTGEPAYFQHVLSASRRLLEKSGIKPSGFDYCIFHMPNAKFPKTAAKRLGFSEKQLAAGFVVQDIGNPYSASALVGLAAVLDIAKPNQKIFFCSYGSGAGSDAFIFETTKHITKHQNENKYKVSDQIKHKTYVDYPTLMKTMMAKGYL